MSFATLLKTRPVGDAFAAGVEYGRTNGAYADESQTAERDGRDDYADSGNGLPVVWHVIVDIPFTDGPFRRTRLSLDEASRSLSERVERATVVERVLRTLRSISDADDWQVTISWKGVRAERDGESYERLERELLDAGFDEGDFEIRVEYARSWGML
ncbi:hypothetical protein [Bifidobacterium vansinderenii]|uniref:Uncharacterized protein n=1 Tax=Bifidobacterium vansinderenii TaxID=1984871 RepID=A0A229VY57_9BIFI|nr:hypothetical protein [Bifidobacterium vansinderenii]OXN00532.1 hypothetical protein Tam10B_1221 [Bifidobacterium vansinderenii]